MCFFSFISYFLKQRFIFCLQGLTDLLNDLVTMETLVYECGADDSLTLETLREMSDYARMEMMMDKVKKKKNKKHSENADTSTSVTFDL